MRELTNELEARTYLSKLEVPIIVIMTVIASICTDYTRLQNENFYLLLEMF